MMVVAAMEEESTEAGKDRETLRAAEVVAATAEAEVEEGLAAAAAAAV